MPQPVQRIGPGDLTELVTDVGPAPMHVGAVLVMDRADPDQVASALRSRTAALPRLRQVLRRPAPGLGRPYWLEAEGSDEDRVTTVRLDDSGLEAVLGFARRAVGTPLDRDRPLWRAWVLDTPDATAVVLCLHHVLADGIGGLAVLAGLADGAGAAGSAPGAGAPNASEAAPVPGPPSTAALLADVWRSRLAGVRGLPAALARLRVGRTELSHARTEHRTARRAPVTSLNVPTGAERAFHVADVDLAAVLASARAAGATVNDCLLVAVTEALRTALERRGERPAALVVSVPVSARASTTAGDLGNQVGVMPVSVPLTGTPAERLALVAAETRARKGDVRGASAALLGPVFRTLARLGLFRYFIDQQRLVNSFLTNLRGPAVPLALAGARIRSVVPITTVAGNVPVAFAALSYAGRLGVTVITDPHVVPEGSAIADAVRAALQSLAS